MRYAMKFGSVTALFLLALPLAAQAGESLEADGRTISFKTDVQVLERNADNKPIKGKTTRTGVTLHEKGPGQGTYSQVLLKVLWEMKEKGGVYLGTLDRTFPNGDEQHLTFQGRFGKGLSKGVYQCADGTGKYANVKCSGTYEGQSFSNGMAANRWTGTIVFAE